MGESDPGGVDIASRIKQFSSNKTQLDSNSNYTNKKPSPVPRRRPQTQEIETNSKDIDSKTVQNRKCVNRSTSSPVRSKKPIIPVKPVTPKSPKSPVTKPRASSECHPTNNNNNIINNKNTDYSRKGVTNNNNNNNIDSHVKRNSTEKPKLPTKPTNIANNDNSKLHCSAPTANIQSKKSWKQNAGPPRKPVPAGPSINIKQPKTSASINNNPLKPLRGIPKMEVYENNEINPINRVVKNNPNQELRRGTLDGQIVLGSADTPSTPPSYANSHSKVKVSGSVPTVSTIKTPPARPPIPKHKPQSQVSPANADDEAYDYTYERQFLQSSKVSPAKAPPSSRNTNNQYDQVDPATLKDFMDTIPDGDDLYQDPNDEDFRSPMERQEQDSFTTENDDLYQDPNDEDFRSPMERQKQQEDRFSGSDDLYQDPTEEDFRSPMERFKQQSQSQQMVPPAAEDEEDEDLYDFPPQSDDDYEEPPPDARYPVHTEKVEESSSDDENYDFPDTDPPPVPRHNGGHQPPPVPSHKIGGAEQPPAIPAHKTSTDGIDSSLNSENNLHSSSSDDEDDKLYNDPENFFTKPPIPNYKKSNRMGSLRRGSNMQPLEYMPVSEMVPVLDEHDELLNDTMYIDPATALSTDPPTFQQNDDDSDDDDDIYSDEPLYQVYNQEVNEAYHRESKKKDEDYGNSELVDDLVSIKKGSTMRILWAELPSVRKSGYLGTISDKDRKRQEAMFEVITSEASYLKSLDILVSHFMLCKEFLPNPNLPSNDCVDQPQMLDRQQYHFLFSGLSAIKGVSERFLKDLRRRQQSSILIDSISDIILDYAENHLQCYVKYCSNQVFQDRTFQGLLDSNPSFVDKLTELEKDPITQGLSLQSFLTLPMQRICRLPLLVDAICNRCEPGSKEFNSTDAALKAVNKVVHESNEGARKMERTEEMYFIQKNLTWKTKPIPLVSSSRWLVKKGDVMSLYEEGRFSKYKNQLRQIFKGKFKPIYIFLFTDIVLVTKMKSGEHFKVIDVCERSLLKVEVLPNIPDPEPPKVGSLATLNVNPLKYAFTLILLENTNNRTVDYHCFLSTETDKTRWLEAFNPPGSSQPSIEGESIYEEWDCPQVQVIHPYTAQQSDELTLLDGDIISVLRKLPDGWAEGMRMRDDEKGWFPINHTDEIDSRHMRAKNLMQRYRLITASKQIVNDILGK